MKISVVIPTKDRLDYLKQVLPTYFMQPEVQEVIVVIDGSTDGTREYLQSEAKKNKRLKYLDNETNRGIPFSKNRGIDAVAYEYCFIAEDDLELTESFFATLLAHKKKTRADIICGRNIFRWDYETAQQSIERTNKMNGPYVNLKTIELNTSLKLQNDSKEAILAAPMLANTAVFKEIRFDEAYRVNFWREETDFQLSARERNYTLFCCPHAICFNFMIKNDKGGVHSAAGFRRAKWIVINNWTFIRKHKVFIEANFEIGNQYAYIARFALKRVVIEVVAPFMVALKQRLRLTR